MSTRWRKQGSRIVDLNTGDAYDVNGAFIQNLAKTDPDLAILSERRFSTPLSASSKPKKTPPAAPVRKAGDKLQNAQPKMTQAPPTKRRVIATPQRGIHTMSGQLAAETAGANNALMAEIIKNRYSLSQFSADDLISFQRDPNLQRAGVDLVTPAGLNLDFKFRGPNVAYDDVLLELVSVDSQRQLGNQIVPSTSKELMGYLNSLSPNDRLGWTMDPKKITNGIVYAMPGRREVMFMNAPVLRDAAPELFDRQLKKVGGRYNPYKKAMNSTYNTVNLPIDTSIMKEVLGSDFVTESY